MRTPSPLPIVLTLLLGCAGADRPEGPTLETWTLEEEVRIGSLDDPDASLTYIGGVVVGEDGRVYASQPMDHQVRIFSPDGEPLGAFGRQGGGPGEFERVGGLAWRGDSLWVLDWGQNRFNVFTDDGELVRTVTVTLPTPTKENPYTPRPSTLLPDGSLTASPGLPSHLIAQGEITHRPWVRMTLDGAVLDTIAVLPLGNSQLALMTETGGMFTGQPFADGPLTEVLAHSAFLIVDREVRDSTVFTLTKLDLGGDTLWSRSYPFEPIVLDAATVDSVVAATAERLSRSSALRDLSAPARESRVREEMHIPPHRTPVASVQGASNGDIWLSMTDTLPESSRWIVLDRTGDPIAEVRLPARTSPRWIGEGLVWASQLDDLDVPYLVRYAVRPAGVVAESTTR